MDVNYEDLLIMAGFMSRRCHQRNGQKYGDKDYFNYHIEGVANLVRMHHPGSAIHEIVAYLHDIVEDCDIPISIIYTIFGNEIGRAVRALTHSEGDNYSTYIIKCASCDIARDVKIQDISFNLTNCVKDGKFEKAAEYASRMKMLMEESLKV